MWTTRRTLAVVWAVLASAVAPPGASAQAGNRVCADALGGAAVRAPARDVAWRAEVRARTAAFARLPGTGRRPARRLTPSDAPWLMILARPRVADHRCWLRVRLPWRPNDAAGWVDAEAVRVEPTPWRIEVSTAGRTLTLYRAGTRLRTVPVVVGKPSTPTPVGLFAVAWAIRWHPEDFLGSWVLELTAHSTVLRRFDGGDGTVGIHGRGGASLRDPLGSARSHGCIRLPNEAIDWLVRKVGADRLPGTPVHIG